MVDDFDFASNLFGTKRVEERADKISTSTIYGTAISKSEDGMVLVKIDGDITTEDGKTAVMLPTSPSVREGDTVLITMSGGVAKSPMVTAVVNSGDRITTKVYDLEVDTAFIRELDAAGITAETIISDQAVIDDLDANYAHITEGVIDNATIGYASVDGLDAHVASIADAQIANATITQAQVENLSTDYAHITSGTIDNANINYANVNGIDAQVASIADAEIANATITQAQVQNLSTDYAHITSGAIDNANISYANVTGLSANYAHITQIDADTAVIDNAKMNNADVIGLDANYAHITDGVIDNAHISHANVDDLITNYARIDAANIDTTVIGDATIAQLWADAVMVQSNLISKTEVSDDVFTYRLNALEVNAESITAGTIDIERLVVTDPNTGEQAFITYNPNTETFDQTQIHGSVIKEKSIAASSIVSNSITTEQLYSDVIMGTGGVIHLDTGNFAFMNASESEGIKWQDGKLTIVGEAIDILAKQSDLESLNSDIELLDSDLSYLQARVRIENRGGNPVIVLDPSGGSQNADMTAELSNTALTFNQNGNMVAQVSNNQLVINDAAIRTASVSENLALGNFSWIPMADGSLAFKWIEA